MRPDNTTVYLGVAFIGGPLVTACEHTEQFEGNCTLNGCFATVKLFPRLEEPAGFWIPHPVRPLDPVEVRYTDLVH